MKRSQELIIYFPALLLAVLYGLSFLAGLHWLFEFLRCLLLPYLAASLLLALIYIFLRRTGPALCMAALFMCLVLDLHNPPAPAPATGVSITIAQFNKHGRNHNLTPTIKWLSTAPAAVVIIQEVLRSDVETLRDAQELQELYPYRYPETRQAGLDIYTLSRQPVKGEIIEIETPNGFRKALRLQISLPHIKEPLSLYSIHTARPAPAAQGKIRKAQLENLARIIAADPSPYIILAGDLNMAPWVPAFKNMLDMAQLRYATTGPLNHATWPSYSRLPFLQIPIDHILANKNLTLVYDRSGPFLGSDHQPYIARFIFSDKNNGLNP